jgi:hypothetical protein
MSAAAIIEVFDHVMLWVIGIFFVLAMLGAFDRE